jgi:hypothetical protein
MDLSVPFHSLSYLLEAHRFAALRFWNDCLSLHEPVPMSMRARATMGRPWTLPRFVTIPFHLAYAAWKCLGPAIITPVHKHTTIICTTTMEPQHNCVVQGGTSCLPQGSVDD